jgi:hypothetical protein
MPILHTEQPGDVAFKEYGDEVEDEGGEESYGSQMDELRREHVCPRLVAKHGGPPENEMIVGGEVVGERFISPPT